MNINDKIKQILIDKNLTPSYFADEIGVQRSSISHILSGRNRPSFDIIQKIIRRFPELGYEWIMEEESSMNIQGANSSAGYMNRPSNRQPAERSQQSNNPATFSPPYFNASPIGTRTTQRTEIPPVSPVASSSELASASTNAPASVTGEKKVERILIFYTDGSFREYTPAS
ncbi:helix-turn-helix transcriptional regulator [Spirosoma taeanense]|uniref:Helix-turn-helix transcriptional regulator n=1 Tax=Spirosoma taeanense TaxID=2735870 RepID=A0A6M5Y6L9_9BACT|nr:helix-turn-helix transcriptional regulator [Spirosoma taeanense]QJW90058.1 helix-turn-helix transcriptional regulator [Spirosoma taeanense]